MRAYIIRRLILIIPTLLLVSIIIFLSVRFIPGDVIDMMVAQMATAGGMGGAELNVEWLRHAMGLDVPVHIQYGHWLVAAVQGDLGNSLWTKIPVTEMIFERLPVSFELAIFGVIAALLIAIPIGVYSAIRQDTGGDYTGRIIAVLLISLPSFWLGTLVVVYPSIWWGWSPAIAYISPLDDPAGNLVQFMVPGIILGMFMTGTTCRMTRTMMLEVLRQDYIRTAWSKGLTEWTVIIRHAFKNALIPVVSIMGLEIAYAIGGVVIIEQIFCLPGVGRLMLEALNKRDYPVVSGINMVLAFMVLIINLVVDMSYAYLDPRIKYR